MKQAELEGVELTKQQMYWLNKLKANPETKTKGVFISVSLHVDNRCDGIYMNKSSDPMKYLRWNKQSNCYAWYVTYYHKKQYHRVPLRLYTSNADIALQMRDILYNDEEFREAIYKAWLPKATQEDKKLRSRIVKILRECLENHITDITIIKKFI